jgi:hypothetical protein
MFPYLVGNNAAGVPRAFLGTEKPTNIYLGTIQARVEYGMEFQSRFSPVTGPDTFTTRDLPGRKRLMSGLVITFSPKMFPGLEIDGARYFHQAWMGHFGADELRTPFEGLVKSKVPRGPSIPGIDDRDVLKNQLAAISFRWVLPRSGVDVYGEYGREDHAEDNRALEVQPDLTRTAMMGVRKAFARADSSSFDALRAEVFDGNPTTMGLHRSEGRTYIHDPLRQGHTEEGKVIGAGAGIGAPSAATIAWDRYRESGRTSIYLLKMGENTRSDYPSAPQTTATAGASAMRFTRFGQATFDVAAVRTTRAAEGWGGWNLTAAAGASVRIP